MPRTLSIRPVTGLPEFTVGDDLCTAILDGLSRCDIRLADGDVLTVSSKIVSKTEGRLVPAADREAAITAETVRVVASRPRADGGTTRIVETRHGFVMAAAGVDMSNVPEGYVLLLPEDSDASARRLTEQLRQVSGALIGVVITDTFGRPWRRGLTDLAIGAAGIHVLRDYRGSVDTFGHQLHVSVAASADEIASAAELAHDKTDAVPVTVISGLDVVTEEMGPGIRALIRPAAEDMFRLGTAEATAAGARDNIR